MKPRGETETALISKLLKFPIAKPIDNQQQSGIEKVNLAKPVMPGDLRGLLLGGGIGGGTLWWKNQSSEEADKTVRALDHTLNGGSKIYDPKQRCQDEFDDSWKRCQEVEERYGPDTARICRETARTRYSQCLAGKLEKEWRNLHDRD